MTDRYENLAHAIVLQAVKEYRRALRKLKKKPDDSVAIEARLSIGRFFYSDSFVTLSNLDPDYLIQQLVKEVVA